MDSTLFVSIFAPLIGCLALAVVAALYLWLWKQDAGTE